MTVIITIHAFPNESLANALKRADEESRALKGTSLVKNFPRDIYIIK